MRIGFIYLLDKIIIFSQYAFKSTYGIYLESFESLKISSSMIGYKIGDGVWKNEKCGVSSANERTKNITA